MSVELRRNSRSSEKADMAACGVSRVPETGEEELVVVVGVGGKGSEECRPAAACCCCSLRERIT